MLRAQVVASLRTSMAARCVKFAPGAAHLLAIAEHQVRAALLRLLSSTTSLLVLLHMVGKLVVSQLLAIHRFDATHAVSASNITSGPLIPAFTCEV